MKEWMKDVRSWQVGKMFGGYEGLGDEFGGPVYSFVACNAAVFRSSNEGFIAIEGFYIKLCVDPLDQTMWLQVSLE